MHNDGEVITYTPTQNNSQSVVALGGGGWYVIYIFDARHALNRKIKISKFPLIFCETFLRNISKSNCVVLF